MTSDPAALDAAIRRARHLLFAFDGPNLFEQVTIIAISVADAINFLELTPTDCLLITSSVDDVEAAQAAGTPSIGYARTPDDAAHLVDAGAITFVYSMADTAIKLRARTSD